MILGNFFLILIILQWHHRLAVSFPVAGVDSGQNASSDFFAAGLQKYGGGGGLGGDDINQTIYDLIDSKSNKAIFAQLLNSDNAFWDQEANIVGTVDFSGDNLYLRQPYVSNGYVGSRIPNLGQGFAFDQETDSDGQLSDETNGWPLFDPRFSGSFISGFYDIQRRVNQTNFPELYEKGYESILSAVPQWTSLQFSAQQGNSSFVLDPSKSHEEQGSITNYMQNLSLSNGIVTTQFTWLDTFNIKIEVLAHRSQINLGLVHAEVTNRNSTDTTLSVSDILDFGTSLRCQMNDVGYDDNGIYINFLPHELADVYGSIYSLLHTDSSKKSDIQKDKSESSVNQSYNITLAAKSTFSIWKAVGIFTSDLNPSQYNSEKIVLDEAREVVSNNTDYGLLVVSHKSAWNEVLKNTALVNFPSDPLLTLAARASVYHLLANTRANATGVTAALPVGGLSSDSYGGMVFWDTDLWISNGLLPFNPDHVKSLVNYRIYTHEEAKKNLPEGYSGAVYPWTSGRYGNCTSTGPCMDYEYHINTAVAMSAIQVYLSGAADDYYLETVTYPLVYDAASFLADYVKYNETLGKYVTTNLTDPDEYANHVDNGAYTNAGISLLMKWAILISKHLGKSFPDQFSSIAGNMYLPQSQNSDNITLEFNDMPSTAAIKQADVIMITYPLENELITEATALNNMRIYAEKQVSYGPAMTFPIFSIVSSKLSPTGCSSQSYLHKAVQPFLRGPFAQFSEQNNDDYSTNGGTNPAFPFMTAHGGFLQAILQGLTGMRFGYDETEQNKISRVLTFDPASLPCLEGGVQFPNIRYMNHSLSLSLTDDSFTIKNNGPFDDTVIDSGSSMKISIADRNPKAGQYVLNDFEELVIPLYRPVQSIPGSVSECGNATLYNITDGVHGDTVLLVNDGDNTTHWQLNLYNETAKVLIDLKRSRSITKGFVNWGDRPPRTWVLSAFNDAKAQKLSGPIEIMSNVDFGNDLHEKYKYARLLDRLISQSDAFSPLLEGDVSVNAPFNITTYNEVILPDSHNFTTFDLGHQVETRYLLVETLGTHDEITASSYGGAKIYEVLLFE